MEIRAGIAATLRHGTPVVDVLAVALVYPAFALELSAVLIVLGTLFDLVGLGVVAPCLPDLTGGAV